MSDHEARRDESMLVSCDQRRYGSVEFGGAHDGPDVCIFQECDSIRDDGREQQEDNDVFCFQVIVNINDLLIVKNKICGAEILKSSFNFARFYFTYCGARIRWSAVSALPNCFLVWKKRYTSP